MSIAQKVLADPNLYRYGEQNKVNMYYTCFPSKTKTFECVKGRFHAYLSNNLYKKSEDWLVLSVPTIVPEMFHETYLTMKNPNISMTILPL
jgi:hypothetical protein